MAVFLLLVLFLLYVTMRGELGTYAGFATAAGNPIAGLG